MKLEQTNDYLLLIDAEAEIKEGDYGYSSQFISGSVLKVCQMTLMHKEELELTKIIAYYPLTKEDKKLDLPELPPFEEVNIKELAEKEFPSLQDIKYKGDKENEKNKHLLRAGFVVGYKAAQSKQFTLDDVKKAIDLTQQICDRNAHYVQRDRNVHVPMITIDEEEEIIQSLSTQQLPKEFIPDYQRVRDLDNRDINGDYNSKLVLKTITNSEGKQELVGTYKY